MKILDLFKNQKTDGFGSEFDFPGGRVHLVVSGTFDGAKVKYQVSYDEGQEYHDYLSGGDKVFTQSELGKGLYIIEDVPVKIRAILIDAGTNTNLHVTGYYNQYYSPKHNLIGVS
jgi:hypothetical protein